VLVAALRLALGSVAILRSRAGEPPGTTSSGTVLPDVKAEGAILVEARSGTVPWSKAPDRRLPPASCTKIMTALIVLEHVHDLKSCRPRGPSSAGPATGRTACA